MKMFFEILGSIVFALIGTSLFFWAISVPEVKLRNNEILEVRDTKGELVPQNKWDDILRGRYDPIWVE